MPFKHTHERSLYPAEKYLLWLQFILKYYIFHCYFNCVWHALSNVEKHEFSPCLPHRISPSFSFIHFHGTLLFIFPMHLFSYSFLSAIELYSMKNVATRLKKSLLAEVDLSLNVSQLWNDKGSDIYDIFVRTLFIEK